MTAPELEIFREAAQAEADGLPFTLVCRCCDAGDDVRTLAEAVAKGWTMVFADPEGTSWTFVGRCPHFDANKLYCVEPGQQEMFA